MLNLEARTSKAVASVSNTLATKKPANTGFTGVSDYTRHNPAYRFAYTDKKRCGLLLSGSRGPFLDGERMALEQKGIAGKV